MEVLIKPGLMVTQNWSIQYAGHSIIELCSNKPKMTLREIRTVINNEGGYIDECGIIHSGSATNKVVEV